MRWLGANLALFALVEAVYSALLGLLLGAPLSVGATVLAVAALFTIPFLPIYLGAVAVLPSTWPRRRRRLAAVAASPILLAVFVYLAFTGVTGVFLLAVALPGALVYGALVRLHDPVREHGGRRPTDTAQTVRSSAIRTSST